MSDQEIWEKTFKDKKLPEQFKTEPGNNNTVNKTKNTQGEYSNIDRRIKKLETIIKSITSDLIVIKKYINIHNKKLKISTTSGDITNEISYKE
jgi:glutaredoxin 2